MKEEQIRKFAKDIKEYHNARIREQTRDQLYYDDEFPVGIMTPFHIVRTGTAARIVDSIVDHIEIANPQVFREPKKSTDKARESALKVAKFGNYLIKQWQLELAEFIRNCVHRGEAIGQVQYNNQHRSELDNSVPLLFTAPDPMVVFCDPYDVLLPQRVVKSFRMKPMAVKTMAPEWEYDGDKKEVEYLAYWDNETRYIEAAKIKIIGGSNYLGFPPIVHCYSGFGKKSYDGRPEAFAVGRLKKIRNRLKEECEIESRIDSIIALYANPLLVMGAESSDAATIDEEALKKQVIGPGETIVIPWGYKWQLYTPEVAAAQLFQHLYQIRQALGLDIPPLMAGQASGSRTSGRLEDILFEHIQKKYSKLINNVELALAELLGMALRILEKTPKCHTKKLGKC